jgi:hypothetical protein
MNYISNYFQKCGDLSCSNMADPFTFMLSTLFVSFVKGVDLLHLPTRIVLMIRFMHKFNMFLISLIVIVMGVRV